MKLIVVYIYILKGCKRKSCRGTFDIVNNSIFLSFFFRIGSSCLEKESTPTQAAKVKVKWATTHQKTKVKPKNKKS